MSHRWPNAPQLNTPRTWSVVEAEIERPARGSSLPVTRAIAVLVAAFGCCWANCTNLLNCALIVIAMAFALLFLSLDAFLLGCRNCFCLVYTAKDGKLHGSPKI